MRSAAAADNAGVAVTPESKTNMRSNLVANAQPVSFTGAPVFDSNVWPTTKKKLSTSQKVFYVIFTYL